MTIAEAIECLMEVPEDQRGLPLYVWDGQDNLPTYSLTLYDGGMDYGRDNPLAVNIDE